MRKAAHCDECEHEWLAEGYPKRCARCKSRRWNIVVGGSGMDAAGVLAEGGKVKVGKPKSEPGIGVCPYCEKQLVDWGPAGKRCMNCARTFDAQAG